MGKVVGKVEGDSLKTVLVWIIPLAFAISTVAILSWGWGFIGSLRAKIMKEYKSDSGRVEIERVRETGVLILQDKSQLKVKTFTQNATGRSLHTDVPIQSARFIKPTEKIVRPDHLPDTIPCEKSRLRMLRNWLFLVPKPRIVVRGFTDVGIIVDEENTEGQQLEVEFYPKASSQL